jgi:hypothetical protein
MPAHLDVALFIYNYQGTNNIGFIIKHPSEYQNINPNSIQPPAPSIMPLVVPGINSDMGDKSEWVNKLMGKKISETSDEVVCLSLRDTLLQCLPVI